MKTPAHVQRALTARRAERGSVLVIAMLIILAMTGIGAVAFTSAITSTRAAAAFSTSRQTELVTQLAAMGAMEELACSYTGRLSALREGRITDYHSSDPLCGNADVTYFGSEPFGRRAATPEFLASFTEATLGRRATGYDQSACYYRIRVEVEGQLEMEPTANRVGADETALRRVRRRQVGYVYVGPVVDSALCGE